MNMECFRGIAIVSGYCFGLLAIKHNKAKSDFGCFGEVL